MAADASKNLPTELENFARMIAADVPAAEAYTRSGVGSALACGVSQAVRHPDVVARVEYLRSNGNTSAPVDKLNDPDLEPEKLTRADVMAMLLRDRKRAHATGQINAAVSAATKLGQEIGMFVERSVAITAQLDIPDIELAQRIAYLLMTGGGDTLGVLPAPANSVTTIEP